MMRCGHVKKIVLYIMSMLQEAWQAGWRSLCLALSIQVCLDEKFLFLAKLKHHVNQSPLLLGFAAASYCCQGPPVANRCRLAPHRVIVTGHSKGFSLFIKGLDFALIHFAPSMQEGLGGSSCQGCKRFGYTSDMCFTISINTFAYGIQIQKRIIFRKKIYCLYPVKTDMDTDRIWAITISITNGYIYRSDIDNNRIRYRRIHIEIGYKRIKYKQIYEESNNSIFIKKIYSNLNVLELCNVVTPFHESNICICITQFLKNIQN